ncbi:DNA/RNA nuclease SfsA [Thermoplasma sp.]|uniref:DNA/RNA nuclease SfsA n=1 Tax=Thermoplasma sp. TaxID=1973142 RepID=UPI00262EC5AE|nr:DNA/RNA nuclease SfsA [Thermoplasma sp.]
MKRFDSLMRARVIERVNRFAVSIDLNGEIHMAHLHDPGRLLDLIYPGSEVLIRKAEGSGMSWRIEFASDRGNMVLVDSGIHSEIARHFLPEGAIPEVKVGRKRIDFRYDDEYVEVKGCTLNVDGIAMFPDAPTRRGLEHLETLESLAESGYRSYILFLIMRDDVECFYPNFSTDPDFSKKFLEIVPSRVGSKFLKFSFDGKFLRYAGEIMICHDALRHDARV